MKGNGKLLAAAVFTVVGVQIASAQTTTTLTTKARRIIAERMLDPSSLVIRNTRMKTATVDGRSVTILCGEYNSKNRFGGYVGFKQFVYESVAMRGVLSFESNLALDFFAEDGRGDVSQDPNAAVMAGADPAALLAAHRRYANFAASYLPVCLGAS